MGWNYPDVSLEDMVKLVKGFIDILILASGYQSSGHPAHWDAHNIHKALQWGLFFQNVLRRIINSDRYKDSVKELDAALSEITSDPSFPQGLVHLSSDTLSRGRDFVLEHFMNNFPLRDLHLKALLTASIECGDDSMRFIEQELLKRQCMVSSVSTVETALDMVSNTVRHCKWNESDYVRRKELQNHDRTSGLVRSTPQLVELSTWNRWKSKNLSYFLNKRTVRLVSGANLIFSAPKVQWVQVLRRLNVSSEKRDSNLHETIELLLLGSVASRWTALIKHFMSVSFSSFTVSEKYRELSTLYCETFLQGFHCKEVTVSSEVRGIFEYLAEVLDGQINQLWKLSPALAAATIPPWSPLFRLYLSEIETHLKINASTSLCSCNQEAKEHTDCELAERIWCFYIFHLCRDSSNA